MLTTFLFSSVANLSGHLYVPARGEMSGVVAGSSPHRVGACVLILSLVSPSVVMVVRWFPPAAQGDQTVMCLSLCPQHIVYHWANSIYF